MPKLETRAHRVTVDNRVVAHLYLRGDYTWLEWQTGYWDDPRRPVLGLRFEDRPRAHIAAALRLPSWFSNLLPEGRLREWVARDAGVSPQREMLLLRRLGGDLPGAVTVLQIDDPVDPQWRPDQVVEAALQPPSLGNQVVPRFSLAGVAMKFSMLRQGDRLTLPASVQDGDWIVKLPDAVYSGLPQNEFGIMTMASLVGIDVPDIRLIQRDELPPLPSEAWPGRQDWAYAIQRFDRAPGKRIHMEDLAQVKGVYPEAKYDGSFATAGAYIYRGRDLDSYLEFIRRLFFSYAVGNGDMHLKNLSLLYPDGRRPVLSPAYDLVSTAPYQPGCDEDLGLRLGRSRAFHDVTPASFEMLARTVNAPVAETSETVASVASEISTAWESVRGQFQLLPGHQKWLDERLPRIAALFR